MPAATDRDRARLDASIEEHEVTRFAPILHELVAPCLILAPEPGAAAAGASKLGGAPDLPDDVAWPEFEGTPMTFLVQLDLAAAAARLRTPLPATGRLLYFAALEPLHELQGPELIRVLHVDGRPAPRTPPAGTPAVVEHRLTIEAATSVPRLPLDGGVFADLFADATEEERERLSDWSWMALDRSDDPDAHRWLQVLGYPRGGQLDVLAACAERAADARRHRALLAIDADPAIGLHVLWGGTLWFLIDDDALAAGDLSRTFCIGELG